MTIRQQAVTVLLMASAFFGGIAIGRNPRIWRAWKLLIRGRGR